MLTKQLTQQQIERLRSLQGSLNKLVDVIGDIPTAINTIETMLDKL